MKNVLAFVLIATSLAACDTPPPISQERSAEGVTSSLVTIVDGCRVWAIDRGTWARTVFMARCPEGAADVQSSYTQSNGKGATAYDQFTIGGKTAK